MRDKLHVINRPRDTQVGGEYVTPHHKDHPFPEKKGFRKILQKLKLIPSPNDHVIYLNPKVEHKQHSLLLDLKLAQHYKSVTQLAVKKLEPLKRKHYKPPRRSILIHEKTHYQQELRSGSATTLHDGWLIYDYLKKSDHPEHEKMYISLIFLRILMESEAIVNEMKSCNSQEYSLIRISALLNRISGDRYKSGLYELLERIKDRKKIVRLDAYIIGQILTLQGNDDTLFIQLLQGRYDLNSAWFKNFERKLLESIQYYLNNPGSYLYTLKNEKNLLLQTISQIDFISSNIRQKITSLQQEIFIPNSVKSQLIANNSK